MIRENISVCMATYNGEEFIDKQIQSIISQFIDGDELIIVDDCSKDNTVSIIKNLNDNRIKLYSNSENIRHVKTFEKCISIAKNKFIFLADQDDIWKNNRVKKFLEQFESYDVDLITSNSDFIDKKDNPSSYYLNPILNSDSKRYSNNISKIFLGKINYYGCAMCFKASLRDYILPIPNYVESHDLWIAMAANISKSNLHFEEKTFFRRIHGNNVTLQKRKFIDKIYSRYIYLKSFIELKFRYANKR